MSNDQQIVLKNPDDLKVFLQKHYIHQINNFFQDENQARKFLSSVMADVQRNPKLMECNPLTLINSYIMMAQLGFMPSGVSGEAYVLPYNNNKQIAPNKWEKVLEAQFQLGYQGLVTLFYKAGVEKITSGIVREKDKTTLINGAITHEVDLSLSKEERGKPIGAYVTVTFRGKDNTKYMNGKDILDHAKRFSKSYDPSGKYSPWNPDNDPDLTMWMKTVLKQHSKLLPKNETIFEALAEDNRDSVMNDRLEAAKKDMSALSMGNLLNNGKENNQDKDQIGASEGTEEK